MRSTRSTHDAGAPGGDDFQEDGQGPVEVLPGDWRWADPAGTDRCGTALATADGLVLVDPPALPPAARRRLEGRAGPVRHVVLTAGRLRGLAAPYRSPGVAVWVGDRGPLPGGLTAWALPGPGGAGGEVALRVP